MSSHNPIEAMNLATYDLRVLQREQPQDDPRGLYGLANGLLLRMAEELGYDGFGAAPREHELRGFVGYTGMQKELQGNIANMAQLLGHTDNGVGLAAGWVKESGAMVPLDRSFVRPDLATPHEVDTAFVQSGVARWMVRKAHELGIAVRDGELEVTGETFLLGGPRGMGDGEHDAVKDLSQALGRKPTEAEFQQHYTKRLLKNAYGIDAEVVSFDTPVGDEIMQRFVAQATFLGGTVLALGNAPSAIQSAGQFRVPARERDPNYDADGTQLFMKAGTIDLALKGEPAATHQNVLTAVPQLSRDYLVLGLQKG